MEFNKKPKKVDPQLHYKIIDNELDGIFNRVVEALKILIQNKSFVNIPEMDNLLDEYKYSQDTVQQFIDDCIERSLLNGITKASTIHEYYISYCSRHKEPHLSLISFCKKLNRKGYQSIKRNDGNYYDIEVEGGR